MEKRYYPIHTAYDHPPLIPQAEAILLEQTAHIHFFVLIFSVAVFPL